MRYRLARAQVELNHHATHSVSGPLVLPKGIPRGVEAMLALLGLIVLAPVLGVVAIAIAVTSRGPVVFRQQRVGRGGRPFTLYKFRTMRASSSGPQVTSSGDTRVTRVGKLLRKTKLDELPQLLNVLKGDMSFVGPRPEVPQYVNLEDSRWQRVLMAKPGITDPVTIGLRNEEELLGARQGNVEDYYLTTLQPDKLRGYIEYLETRNWWRDITICLRTVQAVVNKGTGAANSADSRDGAR